MCQMGLIILSTVHCEDSKKCIRHYKNVVLAELAKVEVVGLNEVKILGKELLLFRGICFWACLIIKGENYYLIPPLPILLGEG